MPLPNIFASTQPPRQLRRFHCAAILNIQPWRSRFICVLCLAAMSSSVHANSADEYLDSLPDDNKISNISNHLSADLTETLKQERGSASLYHLLSAEFSYKAGSIDQAIAIYKQQAFSQFATTVFERALTLSLQHESVEDSLAFALAWHKQNPNHVPAWFFVAHLALLANDYEQAGSILAKILAYDPKADLNEILDGIYPGDEANQRELLTTLQKLDANENASLSVLEAGLLMKFGQEDMALTHINGALNIDPTNEAYINLKANILKKLERHDELMFFLQTVRKRLPEEKAFYLYEIRYLLAKDNNLNAQNFGLTVDDETKNSTQQTNEPSDIDTSMQYSKQAWQLLLTAHKQFPDDAEVTLLAALVSLDLAKYQVGETLLIKLLDRPAYASQAYYYLGISAERQNNSEQAIANFKQVMDAELLWTARKKVVALALSQGDIDDAVATLAKVRTDIVEVGNNDEGILDAVNIDIASIDTQSYLLQAEILRRTEQISAAKAVLKEASQSYPNHSQLVYSYINLLDNTDDFNLKKKLLKGLYKKIQNKTIDDSTNTLIHDKITTMYQELKYVPN